ncbi:MAG TPA: sigma-54 dependent transcriptional regulator [Ignavibacteria bacterium]|nr:Fis family transcriptional regulator [Bacteroidota bacterium]HRI84759.1 sigma-54 dependent transcriptional regulator [Ignavibacteria bacterium]HRJ98188.1 sigma-54 dependent transcriptional regulator [Ignavibacteria bacterium]
MDKILIVDDEENIIESISMILKSEGYETESCLSGAEAINKVKNSEYDLILLDIKMPRMDGIEVLEKIMEINSRQVVIMITGHGTIETAVEAIKKGAYNFLQKPLPDLYELKLIVKNAVEFKKSRDELIRVRKDLIETYKIVGSSEKIRNAVDLVKKFSKVNSNVLVTGESGTGKELAARLIHLYSDKADKPFIEISSANLPEEKTDLELFGGIEDGNFIKGKFELAEGGTIFLDEISNLTGEVQSKLLKVLETNKIMRLGTNIEIHLNARFIFASNRDLLEEVKSGNLREDFFHRINVFRIDLPALREIPEDIQQLTEYFAKKFCTENNIPVKKFSKSAIDLLLSLRWAGNARELKNLVERLIISVDKKVIEYEDIEIPGSRHLKEFSELFNKNMTLNDFQNESEKIFLLKMLNDYKYNISQTADALKIQRSHLYKLLTKYDIPTPKKRSGTS